MINEALKGIRNHISRQSRESGAFRKAARDNSGKIASIAAGIKRAFDSGRSMADDVRNAVSNIKSQSRNKEQNAKTTVSLLQQLVAIQKQILASLRGTSGSNARQGIFSRTAGAIGSKFRSKFGMKPSPMGPHASAASIMGLPAAGTTVATAYTPPAATSTVATAYTPSATTSSTTAGDSTRAGPLTVASASVSPTAAVDSSAEAGSTPYTPPAAPTTQPQPTAVASVGEAVAPSAAPPTGGGESTPIDMPIQTAAMGPDISGTSTVATPYADSIRTNASMPSGVQSTQTASVISKDPVMGTGMGLPGNNVNNQSFGSPTTQQIASRSPTQNNMPLGGSGNSTTPSALPAPITPSADGPNPLRPVSLASVQAPVLSPGAGKQLASINKSTPKSEQSNQSLSALVVALKGMSDASSGLIKGASSVTQQLASIKVTPGPSEDDNWVPSA
jgi:hypothetical protein